MDEGIRFKIVDDDVSIDEADDIKNECLGGVLCIHCDDQMRCKAHHDQSVFLFKNCPMRKWRTLYYCSSHGGPMPEIPVDENQEHSGEAGPSDPESE